MCSDKTHKMAIKRLGTIRKRKKRTTYKRLANFYSGPLSLVGEKNNRAFPIKILIFRGLRNNADDHTCIARLGHLCYY